jgi:hypothetical protein
MGCRQKKECSDAGGAERETMVLAIGEQPGRERRNSTLVSSKPVFAEIVARELPSLVRLERQVADSEIREGVLLRRLKVERGHQSQLLGEGMALVRSVLRQAEGHLEAVRRSGATNLCRCYPRSDPTVAECRAQALERIEAPKRRARRARQRRRGVANG